MHAQTVCTRPLLGGGEGPGDKANGRFDTLQEWTLIEPELSLRDRTRTKKWKQRATVSQESRPRKDKVIEWERSNAYRKSLRGYS